MKKNEQRQQNKRTKDSLWFPAGSKPDKNSEQDYQEHFFYTEEGDSGISYGDPALAPDELKKKKERKAQ